MIGRAPSCPLREGERPHFAAVARSLGAILLMALMTTAGVAASEVLQVGVGRGAWVLESEGAAQADSGSFVLRHEGLRLPLTTEPSSEFSDLIAVGEEWLALGSRVVATGRRDLFAIAGSGADYGEVRLPRGPASADRVSPVLLASAPDRATRAPATAAERTQGLGIVGVAWLEGSRVRDYEVWFSSYENGDFAPPERVAAAAAGSQLALRGAADLDQGSFLIWTAFDGEDDEVFWSRKTDNESGQGLWSPPARVTADNKVPDVVPALSIHDGEIRLVWSRYDGNDYRLVGSVFRDGSWTEPTTLGGPGSLYPRFLTDDASQLLLYYEAKPQGWRLLELRNGVDGNLEPSRTAWIDSPEKERPVIEALGAELVRASWSHLGTTAAAATSAPWREVAVGLR